MPLVHSLFVAQRLGDRLPLVLGAVHLVNLAPDTAARVTRDAFLLS